MDTLVDQDGLVRITRLVHHVYKFMCTKHMAWDNEKVVTRQRGGQSTHRGPSQKVQVRWTFTVHWKGFCVFFLFVRHTKTIMLLIKIFFSKHTAWKSQYLLLNHTWVGLITQWWFFLVFLVVVLRTWTFHHKLANHFSSTRGWQCSSKQTPGRLTMFLCASVAQCAVCLCEQY